jgi:hypothetical protein
VSSDCGKNIKSMIKNIFQLALFVFFSTNVSLNAQNPKLLITVERDADNSVTLSYTKELPGTYTVNLEFTHLENTDAQVHQKIVVSGYSGSLLKLKPINTQMPISLGYKYTPILGAINPKIDSLVTYCLPLKLNKKIKIIEAVNVDEKYFSNKEVKTWKMYVANMQTADTVCCMRKGIVVDIKTIESSNTQNIKEYTSKTNQILIEHNDGTYSKYIGFDKDKIFVKLGETVYPQSQLGVLGLYNVAAYRLDFYVYYLVDFNLEQLNNQNILNKNLPFQYLTPNFITKNGIEKLKDQMEYSVACNKETIFQELTKKEKKKLEKEPKSFY